ncbi:MAG: hypothetical protein H6727_09310 [Myxococcales bacterium]|nr:hypothetical protein [Myxococcales bacterium]
MINLLDIALIALGGGLLMGTSVVCAAWERPLTHALKWWGLILLFLTALALGGCATTGTLSTGKQTQLIQAHISDLAQELPSLRKSDVSTLQKPKASPKTDPVTLTREQWLLVRSAQLRRQAKLKWQRIELEACKKAMRVQVGRERKKREHVAQQYKALLALEKRRAVLPWVFVGVVSTVAVVGFVLYLGKNQ